jgi:hypothetical protein
VKKHKRRREHHHHHLKPAPLNLTNQQIRGALMRLGRLVYEGSSDEAINVVLFKEPEPNPPAFPPE